jgi:predicted acetyltransferase
MVQPRSIPPLAELLPATIEAKPVLSNLYQLYIHDLTEFVEQALGDDGRFGYDPLPQYWTEPDRFPFLVKAEGRLAGFALVKRGSSFSGDPNVWDMGDFFIIRGARGHGVGTAVAQQLWWKFPGVWEIRVMPANIPALQFWKRAISRFVGHAIEPALITKAGETRWLFRFEYSAGY